MGTMARPSTVPVRTVPDWVNCSEWTPWMAGPIVAVVVVVVPDVSADRVITVCPPPAMVQVALLPALELLALAVSVVACDGHAPPSAAHGSEVEKERVSIPTFATIDAWQEE